MEGDFSWTSTPVLLYLDREDDGLRPVERCPLSGTSPQSYARSPIVRTNVPARGTDFAAQVHTKWRQRDFARGSLLGGVSLHPKRLWRRCTTLAGWLMATWT